MHRVFQIGLDKSFQYAEICIWHIFGNVSVDFELIVLIPSIYPLSQVSPCLFKFQVYWVYHCPPWPTQISTTLLMEETPDGIMNTVWYSALYAACVKHTVYHFVSLVHSHYLDCHTMLLPTPLMGKEHCLTMQITAVQETSISFNVHCNIPVSLRPKVLNKIYFQNSSQFYNDIKKHDKTLTFL